MIDMKVTGIRENVLRLRNIGARVHENARKTMHAAADRIVETAKKMAPVDEHNLEDAIVKRVDYEGSRRRLAIDIEILPEVNGVRVEEYATYMHEGHYKLGPKSQAKNDSQSERVGPGFLTRAAEGEEDKLGARMIGVITEESE
ncbi:tail completion or Neck1 protein [Rhizobium phage RHEph10]|uniref:tail completion or Neck1 protein n=1 Tax=Rhizobium phage RHEph10 TaxID=1220717 RepID=UPI0002AB108A|nr:tail completion or Neck1 protein [Rhizobium phage RHEph10]AGC36052.1 putative head-to-tail joining protein [Rhizobium phage RHEph10]